MKRTLGYFDTQTIRFTTQVIFLLLVLYIGWQVSQVIYWLDSGGIGQPPRRPPGAEGFLPIASLMSLKYLLLTGTVHMAHPAGLYLLLAFLLMSIWAGKSFCAWICPVGFLSETLEAVHQRLFGRILSLPRWLDIPLRSLKYLLFAFFFLTILGMGTQSLLTYLQSPYHALADIKMYRFFAHITPFVLWIMMGLFVFSLLIPYAWCRYLCPYGAFLGLAGTLSPTRIRRMEESCVDCGKCSRECPARILVDQIATVRSDECTSCYRCVDSCPVPAALAVQTRFWPKRISTRSMGAGILLLFLITVSLAILKGHWVSEIPSDRLLDLYPGIDTYLHTP